MTTAPKKIATVTVTDDAHAAGSILPAGTYRVEMPADYDPSKVTGEDILCDPALRTVRDEDVAETTTFAVLDESCSVIEQVLDLPDEPQDELAREYGRRFVWLPGGGEVGDKVEVNEDGEARTI